MPTNAGPNTYGEENLVFGYDLGDSKNSYKGEPTTNIVPNPQNNSRFTTNNNWYTYNTAQYNGNTYFSIGTVGSVTNNEVTLSSVSRTLYDYDCIRPQTSGGGVTAGTDYFVKKTGVNSFTLHAYNGSQDGSQGYRNPVTGQFKVHDSIALDQRVTIDATNFPTMWWGSPHKPNMCYVKEVVASGGPNNDSSFMRIHLTRPAGTDGGMAYGVYPQVTQGDTVTLSFWARSRVNSSWSWSSYFNAGFSAASGTINSTTEWKRFQYTWTASNTFGFYMYFWPGNPGSVPYYVDLADIQVEINRGHATPFTLSSRSATQGLIDLTGTYTINLSNVSFDSNAIMDFDGTNDYVTVGTNTDFYFGTGDFTIEAVFTPTDNGNAWTGVVNKGGSGDTGFAMSYYANGNGTMTLYMDIDAPDNTHYSSGNLTSGQTYHIVMVYDRDSAGYVYNNGTLTHTHTGLTGQNQSINSARPLRLGCYDNAQWFMDGKIHMVKLYDRALTGLEVDKNYKAIKNRFNI